MQKNNFRANLCDVSTLLEKIQDKSDSYVYNGKNQRLYADTIDDKTGEITTITVLL